MIRFTSKIISQQVALVEIQLNNDSEVPVGLLVAFVICTTLLIAVHMLSLMIATCILPHIESVAIIPGTTEYSANDGTHDRLRNYIEMSWFFSTTIGIFLFLVEIDLICWVKFWNYGANSGTNVGKFASISVTIALIPIFILFITFAVKFYRNLVTYQFEKSLREILEMDSLINQLNSQGASKLSESSPDLATVATTTCLQNAVAVITATARSTTITNSGPPVATPTSSSPAITASKTAVSLTSGRQQEQQSSKE